MSEVRLFDAYGNSVPHGMPPIDTLDLRGWPGCQTISDHWTAEIEFIIILSDNHTDLPSQVLAQAIAALEDGGSVVVHARSDELASEGAGKIMRWLGGTIQ
jgi:hypothetical protein